MKVSAQYIGFDIGAASVKAAEITAKGGKVTIANTYKLETPPYTIIDGMIIDYSELARQVKNVYSGGGFSPTKPVALALKGGSSIVRAANVPFVSLEQLNKNALFMSEQYMNVDLEQYSIDYTIARTDETQGCADIIFAANRHDTLSDYISIFQSADIDIKLVDLEVLALCNLYNFMSLPEDGVSMIMHIGKTGVYHIFLKEGKFSYYETSQSGGDICSDILVSSAEIDMDDVESVKSNVAEHESSAMIQNALNNVYFPALLSEAEEVINTYMLLGGSPPDRVFLSGGGASTYGIIDAIKARLELNSTIMNPEQAMNIADSVAKQIIASSPAVMNVAIAMALR